MSYYDNTHYYIYYMKDMQHITILEIDPSDEYKYTERYFYSDSNGNKYKFSSESQAIEFLNDNFKKVFIDPEFYSNKNVFCDMVKGQDNDNDE